MNARKAIIELIKIDNNADRFVEEWEDVVNTDEIIGQFIEGVDISEIITHYLGDRIHPDHISMSMSRWNEDTEPEEILDRLLKDVEETDKDKGLNDTIAPIMALIEIDINVNNFYDRYFEKGIIDVDGIVKKVTGGDERYDVIAEYFGVLHTDYVMTAMDNMEDEGMEAEEIFDNLLTAAEKVANAQEK